MTVRVQDLRSPECVKRLLTIDTYKSFCQVWYVNALINN